ncbi:phage tail tape measure protein [Clostridium felsineum]|uniref:Phage tail tape measure protein domain-containing protein n=1 Tax=Clostridium felsineum TaxID=36839 RepID=A0A1S8KZQ8_9CLOT|nr:phage tail tape measure protein [Clostridium felsineum]URZ06492.1 hypothetical protein CLROS_018250 [Clostridium felsineum]URZ11527.1 hypothetical protein CROST_022440 [Clostridium felsineum]
MAQEDIADLAIRLSMEDASFTQGVQNLKRNLGVIDAGFKESIAGLKDWGKNVDALKNNASALGEKIETQQKIVKEYQEQLNKTKQSLQESSQKMLDLKERVQSAKTAWEESKQELGANAEATQKLKKDYSELNAEYEKSEQKVRSNAKSMDGYNIQLDKQQAKLKEMQAELATTNKHIAEQSSVWLATGKQLETASKKMKTVGEGFTTLGATMSTHFTVPIVAGLGLATKASADFEHEMADIQKEIAAKGEDVKSVMGEMSSLSLKWSEDFGQSTENINESLLTLVKDGYSGSESMQIMGTALNTARGANEDLAAIVDGLGSSLEAYKMKTDNAAETTSNMAHLADTFAYIANHTKASVISLSEGFSTVGPTASALHQPMEEVAASLGVLQSNGIDASTAATSLQAGLVNLTKPTKKMKEALDEMKYSAFDSHGKMKELTTIITEMNSKMAGWTEQQKQAAIAAIFGKESLASWNVLMGKGGDYLKNLSTNANNATGEVKKLSDSMKDTSKNNFKELEESVHALGVAFGKDVLPVITPLVKDITEDVNAFSNLDDATKKNIIEIGGLIALGGPLIAFTGKTIKGIGNITGGLSKLSDWFGKKLVEKGIKDNTTAQDTNTKSVATNTETLVTNTKAEAENTAATGLNTKAKETNSKANGDYKNTIDDLGNTVENSTKKTGTAAEEVENLGKATASTAEKTGAAEKTVGKLASTAAETAGKAGIAASAVEGLGSVAGGAEAGLASAEGGAVALGGAVAGIAAPIAIGVGAIALVGAAGYEIHKKLTDNTIPTIDLFADDVETQSTNITNSTNDMATGVVTSVTKISDSTKQAVGAYEKLNDSVTKTEEDIYINSDKFSTQTKNTVINNFSDIVNANTGFDDEIKGDRIRAFSEIVEGTNTLTTENKDTIVNQYKDLLHQTDGLTLQQKDTIIKNLKDTMTNSVGITASQVQQIKSKYDEMTNMVNSATDKRVSHETSVLQGLFSKSTSITADEQQAILSNITRYGTAQKDETSAYEQQILQIYSNAASQHRKTTQQENQQIAQIRDTMNKNAVQTLSKSEVDSKIIMQRLKDYNKNMTDQQASDTVQAAEKARQGAVKAANDKYNQTMATIIQERDGTHSITEDQADKMIKEAKRQRDESINKADDMKEGVIKKVQALDGDAVWNMDTSTGEMLGAYDKLKKNIGETFNQLGKDIQDIIGGINSWLDKHPIIAKIGKSIGDLATANWGGLAGDVKSLLGFAKGTENAPQGWAWVGEEGPELMWFQGGEQVIPHGDSQTIVQQMQKTGGSTPAMTADSDKLKTTETYGENLNVNFGKGLTNSVDYAINPLNNMTSKLNTTMDVTANRYIGYGKKNVQNLGTGISQSANVATTALGNLTDTLNTNMGTFSINAVNYGMNTSKSVGAGITNKSQEVIGAQQGVTNTLNSNLSKFATDATSYGTHTDSSIQVGLQNNSNAIYTTVSNITSTIGILLQSFANGCNIYGTEAVNSVSAGIQQSESNLTNIVKDLTDKVTNAFNEGFDVHSPSRKLFWTGTMVGQGLMNGIQSKNLGGFIKKWLGNLTGNVQVAGGNISSILAAALNIDGEPLTWLPALEMIASRESGTPGVLGTGDASLVNSIGVGNEFATGLMQMLPSTFQSYMKAGFGSITNGLDNAVAAIRYIADRYKTPFAIPNWNNSSYIGYATGTDNASKGWRLTGEEGPEWVYFSGGETVLNNKNTSNIMDNFKGLLNAVKNTKLSIPDVSGTHYNTTNNVTNNNYNTPSGTGGDVNINLYNPNIYGYKDVKKLMRDAYNIQVNYQQGKGAY